MHKCGRFDYHNFLKRALGKSVPIVLKISALFIM